MTQNTIGKVATTVYTEDGSTRVIYHETRVVQFNADLIVLDSGGWRTSTTKTRMNQTSQEYSLGYFVFQKDFDWFVRFEGKTFDFEDGMEVVPTDYADPMWGDE